METEVYEGMWRRSLGWSVFVPETQCFVATDDQVDVFETRDIARWTLRGSELKRKFPRAKVVRVSIEVKIIR